MSSVWYCSVCTFKHSFPGARCSMCNSLRVTTQQMRDFIAGKSNDTDTDTDTQHGEPSTTSGTSTSATGSSTSRNNESTAATSGHVSTSSTAMVNHANGNKTNIRPTGGTGGPASSSSISRIKSTNRSVIKNPYAKSKSKGKVNNNVSSSNESAHRKAISMRENSQTNNTNRAKNSASSVSASASASKRVPPLPAEHQNSAAMNSNHSAVAPTNMRQNSNKTSYNPNATRKNGNGSVQRIQNPYAKKTAPVAAAVSVAVAAQIQTWTSSHNNNNEAQTQATRTRNDVHKQNQDSNTSTGSMGMNTNNNNNSSTRSVHTSENRRVVTHSNATTHQNRSRHNHNMNSQNGHDARANMSSVVSHRVNEGVPPTRPQSSINKGTNSRANGYKPATTAGRTQQSLGFRGQNSNASIVQERNIVLRGFEPGPVPLIEGEERKTWIYPKSDKYEERDYQLAISRTAINENTLVSLPTGLGKTLIAAVVMYNFYRWFPTGKIVFCAPTRPLVRQQIEACYNIMGVPEVDTAEISGNVRPADRQRLWRSRRLFFCTPQAFLKDIESGHCDTRLVVCLVLDEAHKATGKYAYTQVIEQLNECGAKARLIGLSATPGRDLQSIETVIKNLGVSKIEARIDTDEEVKKYTFNRSNEVIVVQQPNDVSVVESYLNKVIKSIIDMLRERGGLREFRGTSVSITPYNLLKELRAASERNEHHLRAHYPVAQQMVMVRQALRENGIGIARKRLLSFMQADGLKGYGLVISKSDDFQKVWSAVVHAQDTGKSLSQDNLQDLKLNNPKMDKLEFILNEHFSRCNACGESTRAIVFSQWRDSVEEIVNILQGSKPLVQATKFIGQSTGSSSEDASTPTTKRSTGTKVAGMNQKTQQKIIKDFRNGSYNVLVCTCIGEEGLDIGQVDLIVNFDCLSSPIRMVQRTGRTGRSRDGRVVCLVSEGQEENRLRNSKEATKRLWNALKSSSFQSLSKSIPLFPERPVLRRQNMNVVKEYRLSQIGGHSQRQAKKSNKLSALNSDSWHLNDVEEMSRFQDFGQCAWNKKIYKQAIKAWKNSIQLDSESRELRPTRSLGKGTTSAILRVLEMSANVNVHADRGIGVHTNSNRSEGDSYLPSQKQINSPVAFNEELFDENFEDDEPGTVFSPGEYLPESHACRATVESTNGSQDCMVANKKESNDDINFDEIFGPLEASSGALSLPNNIHSIIFGESSMYRIDPPEGCATSAESCDEISIESSSASIECDKEQEISMGLESPRDFDTNIIYGTPLLEETTNESPIRVEHVRNLTKSEFIEKDRLFISSPAATNMGACDEADGNTRVEEEYYTNDHLLTASTALTFSRTNRSKSANMEIGTESGLHAKEIPVGTYGTVNDEIASRKAKLVKEHLENDYLPTASPTSNNLTKVYDKNSRALAQENLYDKNSRALAQENIIETTENNKCIIKLDQDKDYCESESQAGQSICFDLSTQDSSSSSSSSSIEIVADADERQEQSPILLPTASASEISSLTQHKSHVNPQLGIFTDNKNEDEQEHDIFVSKGAQNDKSKDTISQLSIQKTPQQDAIAQGNAASSIIANITSVAVSVPKRSFNNDEDVIQTTDSALKPRSRLKLRQRTHLERTDKMLTFEESVSKTDIDEDDSPIFNRSRVRKTSIINPFLSQVPETPDISHVAHNKVTTGDKLSATNSLQELNDTPITDSLKDTPTSEHNKNTKQNRIERLAKRRKMNNAVSKFFDIEAGVSTSEDEDDQNSSAAGEFSQDSFINDSSQLGFTQDALDTLECEKSQNSGTSDAFALHRRLDMTKAQDETFATPILARSRNRSTPSSIPSSEKNLGKMHFIRSVIEHHKKGGDANEIESEYHAIMQNTSTVNRSSQSNPSTYKSQRTDGMSSQHSKSIASPSQQETSAIIKNNPPNTIPMRQSTSQSTQPTQRSQAVSMQKQSSLTEEQRARIEQNRQRALRLRQKKMNMKNGELSPMKKK